jgi:hypothetical protein
MVAVDRKVAIVLCVDVNIGAAQITQPVRVAFGAGNDETDGVGLVQLPKSQCASVLSI